MSLLSQLYDKVVSLTGRLNQIEENAKTNDEFPTQSELVLSSKIRVSNGGVTEVISVEDIILKAVATSQPYLNRFIETTGISSTGLGISINPNWIWMINGIRYSNPVENSFVNYYAATGFQRIDIIVATENVDFQLIHGIEAEIGVETPVAPVLPINALLVTTILVGDDSMDSPTLPESGYDFLISTDSDNAIVLGSDGKLWSGGGIGGSVPDATESVKGKVKLAGDLGGTADSPTVPALADKQDLSEKNASSGYVGLSGFQIAFKNHLNTITSFFANYNTGGSRTYTFPDKSMTVAGTDDIPTVDTTPTDGSSNAVSSNGVFDGLALKQNALTETNFGSFINGLTAKNTLVDADEVVSDDSADSNKAKKTSWLNVWTNYLKPKADALYQAILTDVTFGTFSNALTPKTTPVDADTINLSDSADSNKAKKLSFANLKAWILSFVPTVITSETGVYYFNDFLGEFKSSTNDGNISSDGNVGQTTTAPNSDANKQGFVNVNTTTATAGYGNIHIGHTTAALANFILGGGITSYETLIWLPSLSTSGERFSCLIGFSSGVANQNNSSNNIAFLYDEGNIAFAGAGGASANWRAVTIDSATRTFTDTGIAVNAATFIKLKIVVNANASSVGFFIDNTLVATHTTNIPSGDTKRLNARNYIQKSVGSAPRLLILDYVKLQQTFTTAR